MFTFVVAGKIAFRLMCSAFTIPWRSYLSVIITNIIRYGRVLYRLLKIIHYHI